MRLTWFRPLLIVSCVLVVAACGDRGGRGLGGKSGKSGDLAVVYEMEGRLDILAWPDFSLGAQGRSDLAWMRVFEKATACEVHVQRATRAEQLFALAERNGSDLVLATGDVAGSLIQGGLVQALAPSRIPGLAGVTPALAHGPWLEHGGVRYGVPFQWSAMRLQYDSRALGANTGVELADIFEERRFGDGKSNVGRVRAFDRPIQIADAALYLRAARPDLGITDPFALDEKQYAAALGALRQQRRLAASNDAAAVIAGNWSNAGPLPVGQPLPPMSERRPSDGATGFVAVSMLRTGAKHPNCAMAWMQWSLQPGVQAQVSAAFQTLPVTRSACTVPDGLGQSWCDSRQVDRSDQLWFWRTPTARCGKKVCVPYSRWVADFAALANEAPAPVVDGK